MIKKNLKLRKFYLYRKTKYNYKLDLYKIMNYKIKILSKNLKKICNSIISYKL